VNGKIVRTIKVLTYVAEVGLLKEGALGTHKFFVSDVPEKFSQVATRFLGEVVDKITRVDISGY